MKIISCLFFFLILTVSGYPLAVSDILRKSADHDNRRVEISGEVIGKVLNSGAGWWVNILDKGSAVGLFCPQRSFFDTIGRFGNYNNYGDMVRAEGVFYANCRMHGETDIHLEKLFIIKPGVARRHVVDPRDVTAAQIMMIIFTITGLIYWKNYKQIREKNTIKPYAARNRKTKKRV